MKRLLIPLLVVFLMLAIPSTVGAAATVVTWESYTTGSDNYTEVYAGNWVAQSINISDQSHSIFAVRLMLYRVGEPGTVTVGVTETDDTGLPLGDDLVVGTFNGDYVTNNTAGAWYTILMNSEDGFANDVVYAVVISAESGDDDDYICVRLDDSAATYAGGSAITTTNGGLSWSADTDNDLMFAISGRALISIEDAKCFQDCFEDGDLLFAMSYINEYDPFFPLDDAASYFVLQLYDTDGTLLEQDYCQQWGYKPGFFYFDETDVADLGLTVNTLYTLGIEGMIDESPTANYTMVADDWKGTNLDKLDTWIISLARSLEDYYGIDLLEASGSDEMLNDQGAVIFLTAYDDLLDLRPDLFLTGDAELHSPEVGTGAFDDETTWEDTCGSVVFGAVNSTADMVGVDEPQNMAGILLMAGYLILALALVGVGVDAMVAALLAIPMILVGTELRVLPFAFITAISVVAILLLVYRFWWSRT